MTEIDRAIMILREKYAEGKRLRFVRDPISWALYQTWKMLDWKKDRQELTEKFRIELKEALNRVDAAEIGTLDEAPEALRLTKVLRSTLLPMIIEREAAGKAKPRLVCRMPLPKAVTIGATTFGAGTAVLGHCPRCGEWVKPPWNYCPACGQAVEFYREGEGDDAD